MSEETDGKEALENEDDEEQSQKGDRVSTISGTVQAQDANVRGSVSEAFSPKSIRNRLKKGEHSIALIEISTALESILAEDIKNRLDINQGEFEGLFGNTSVGRYVDVSYKLGFIDNSTLEKIKSVANYRKKLVHNHGYVGAIENDPDLQDEIKEVVKDALEYIGKTKN